MLMNKAIQQMLKGAIDIVLSLVGLIILALPFALIALAIKLDSQGPVFFRQERVAAIGDNQARRRLWEKLKKLGYELACAIHPSAQIAGDVSIGPGTVIMANTAINSGTEVGVNAIINTGATIDHDCVIEDYVHISPGAHLGGNVRTGELAHIGIGVSVIQGIKIGESAIIGAGAAVIDDIPDNVTAMGVPARVIRRPE